MPSPGRLPSLAAGWSLSTPIVLIASSSAAAVALKSATASIPIVSVDGSDPVGNGLVQILSCPDGNITGISSLVRIRRQRDANSTGNRSYRFESAVLANPGNPPNRWTVAEEMPRAASCPGHGSASRVRRCTHPAHAPEPRTVRTSQGRRRRRARQHRGADRVVHAYGKSLRDLVRVRRSDLGRVPDVRGHPGSEDEVEAVLHAVLADDAVVIPFGGGTNIAGQPRGPAGETRPVVSIDLGGSTGCSTSTPSRGSPGCRPGCSDPPSRLQLAAQGLTLGHFPDSFAHSTLGGWIATRSSGMQSDKYGDIADITRGLRMVDARGTLVVRPVPSTSTGPSVREMVLGSEGRLGIITEATVQVHRYPRERTILAYFFPEWAAALAAMRDIAASDAAPSVTRCRTRTRRSSHSPRRRRRSRRTRESARR